MAGENPLDFYNEYEDAIKNWNSSNNADNEDWQAMKDAYTLSSADKLQNYALQQALSATALADEKAIMEHSAYLDYENTKGLMSEEHQDKISGMREANTLSKDYLKSESAAQESLAKVQGEQAVNLQAKANEASVYQSQAAKEAQLGVALSQKAASEYGADRALAGQVAQASATEYAAKTSKEAAADTAAKQLEGSKYESDADKYARTYLADQQKASALEVAKEQRGSAKEVAQEQRGSALEVSKEQRGSALEVAKEQRGSAKEVAEEQSRGELNVAKEQRGSALETERERSSGSLNVAREQRAAAQNVESIRQRGESARNTARLASEERRIGLMGQEERRTSRDKRRNAVEIARSMSRRG